MYLHQLTETSGASFPPAGVTRILASKACRHAIMFGDPLTRAQSQQLVSSLLRTSQWGICAHGRPTNAPLFNLHAVDSVLYRRHPTAGPDASDNGHNIGIDRHNRDQQQRFKTRHKRRRPSDASASGVQAVKWQSNRLQGLGRRLGNALRC